MTFFYILPWNVTSKSATITSQQTGTPLALVPHFHGGNILVKSHLCPSPVMYVRLSYYLTEFFLE
jgi:hypothetical protein